MGPVPSLEVSTLPKLMTNRANWVTFKRRMTVDIAARPQLTWHLEGTAPYPKHPAPLKAKPMQQEQDEYDKCLEKYADAIDLWRARDTIIQRQIVHNIPDNILIRVQNLTTAAEMWEALQKEFEGRTTFIQDDLRYKIQSMKCSENGNLREHIDHMRYMLEELARMGATILDAKCTSMVMRSLPATYAVYLAPIITTRKSVGMPVSPYEIMDFMVGEYDRRMIHSPPKQWVGGAPPTGYAALYSFALDTGRSG